ncbi:MAG: LacI family DNA-binding transcriptional regulator [Sphingomonadaceae bacterium]|nr:LacI family DNA-binding transcriptional regulator [Sphingomonadaceae bacterium]
MPSSKTTLKDLAAHLGLAHSTVSRALSNHDAISQDTKDRVRHAARQYGYVANSGARLLRTGHSQTVGLLVPDIVNEFYATIAKNLADDCSQRGHQLMLLVSDDDPQRELKLLQALLETRPAGVVVALTAVPRKETLSHLAGVRCIQFLRVHAKVQGLTVGADDAAAARMAIEHLLSLGHRAIGYVGVSEALSTGAARLRGYKETLEEAGVAPDPALIALIEPSVQGGARAAAQLMDRSPRPTALFLSSPQLALGGAQWLNAAKLRVPGDVSVISYGNSSWFDLWGSGLTAVSLPIQELAATASALLFRESGEELSGQTSVLLAPSLVKRGSTARMRA